MVRLMPKAKLSSLPLNHLASAVVTATIIDSAPRPSTVLPDDHQSARLPLAAVRTRPEQAKDGERGDRFLGADAVDDDAADQQRRDRGHAVAGIQPAELRGGESEMVDEDSFQRVDAVVDVIIPAHGQADEDQNRPAVGRPGVGDARFRASALFSR